MLEIEFFWVHFVLKQPKNELSEVEILDVYCDSDELVMKKVSANIDSNHGSSG